MAPREGISQTRQVGRWREHVMFSRYARNVSWKYGDAAGERPVTVEVRIR